MSNPNPYFRNYWGVPSSSSSFHQKPSFKGIPVAAPKPKASPKVISIPVHFVGAERTRSDSALKIQKVLRGFLVRKSLKKIATVSNEVNQIERRISDHETIDLIQRDSRERLRISETLMNLLLRLDSVTSVDFGVRGCRKSVIKKAIALQEKLDLIGHGGVEFEADNTNGESQEVESDLRDEAGDYCNGREEGISEFQSLVKQEDEEEAIAVNTNSELCENVEETSVCVPSEVMSDSEGLPENAGHVISTLTVNPSLENETITEAKENGMKETLNETSVEEEKESNSSTEIEGRDMVDYECEEAVRDDVKKEEQNGERELLQRMIEDNERMMGMMAELFERNAIQTRLLSSLSDRVQKLEKAFVCEKLKKKKRRNAASATDVYDKLPEKQEM